MSVRLIDEEWKMKAHLKIDLITIHTKTVKQSTPVKGRTLNRVEDVIKAVWEGKYCF